MYASARCSRALMFDLSSCDGLDERVFYFMHYFKVGMEFPRSTDSFSSCRPGWAGLRPINKEFDFL